jgi:hypothetical protein
MRDMRRAETEEFPSYGARARTWTRFERDLQTWLATPEGRVAVWRAAHGDRRTAPSATRERPRGS